MSINFSKVKISYKPQRERAIYNREITQKITKKQKTILTRMHRINRISNSNFYPEYPVYPC